MRRKFAAQINVIFIKKIVKLKINKQKGYDWHQSRRFVGLNYLTAVCEQPFDTANFGPCHRSADSLRGTSTAGDAGAERLIFMAASVVREAPDARITPKAARRTAVRPDCSHTEHFLDILSGCRCQSST